MKKILFYTANGVGLGHLQRAYLLAEKLKSRKIELILVTLARSPQIFGKLFDYCIKLTPLSDNLFKNPAQVKKTRLANGKKLAKALKKFKPDIIVADFYLTSSFAFSIFKYALDQFPVKSIFIWRLNDKQKFINDFDKENKKLDYFQKIILPHTHKEIEDLLSLSLVKEIKKNKKFEIAGPIFQRIDNKKIAFCREKYKIHQNDFLITITVGGGGKLKVGQCDNPSKIIKQSLDIYPSLVKKIDNLKIVIITGPYFEGFKKKSSSKLRFIRFEKNLLELIKLSKLVISSAGYNTCNEIVVTKTPAILIPLQRGDNEQFERASYLSKKGVVKALRDDSLDNLLDLILGCKKNLKKMKNKFENLSNWKRGNKKAAKIILKTINE